MTIDITFETHSTTEDNEAGIATGWNPGRLSATGRAQAEQLGRRRAHGDFDAVFSSDLRRAVETVSIAFPDASNRLFLDWRLRECDYGSQNGTLAEYLDRPAHIDVSYPGGESWRGAIERVAGCIEDLRRDWAGGRVLVIGHTATGWALQHVAAGAPIEVLVGAPFVWHEGWEHRIR